VSIRYVSTFVTVGSTAALALVLHLIGGITITPIIPYLSTLYPGSGFYIAFGLWFGLWGAIGVYIGTMIGGIIFGWPLFIVVVFMLVNFITALLPKIVHKAIKYDLDLKDKKGWAAHIGFNAIVLSAITATWGTWMFVYFMKWITEAYWWPFWAGWFLGNVVVGIIIGSALLKLLSRFIVKTPLYVKSFIS
jgi:hypothetical protein